MKAGSIFISSVQQELAEERRALKAFIEGDALLRRFFKAFLFEDLPARDQRVDQVYLDTVDRCAVYVGLFGNEYGYEDADGVSPTQREFERATKLGKPRLIFVKGADDKARHAKMRALVRMAGDVLIRRRFTGVSDLNSAVYASLVDHLEHTGGLRTRPFDASACPGASLADISEERLHWFVRRARAERRFVLPESTALVDVLAHLGLLDGEAPTHAAVLLFGSNPQRFLPASEVKCMHFHGTEVQKPIPSYQIYKGTVFQLVDQALDFVLSKIARGVGTRSKSSEAPVTYELPWEAVAEAIVNAIAHRDYASNASVQVMLFSDRLEVMNPGELPPPLTMEWLHRPHPSIPRNPLVADPLFLARYIEKAGSGTLDMIRRFKSAGLPEPEFIQDGGIFVQRMQRDWLTEEVLSKLAINERQRKAIAHLRAHDRIANSEYRRITAATSRTATRDLDDLVEKGVFERSGSSRRGAYYLIARDQDKIETFRTSTAPKPTDPKRDSNGPKEPGPRASGSSQAAEKGRKQPPDAPRPSRAKGARKGPSEG